MPDAHLYGQSLCVEEGLAAGPDLLVTELVWPGHVHEDDDDDQDDDDNDEDDDNGDDGDGDDDV